MNRISPEIIAPSIRIPVEREEAAPRLLSDLVLLVKARLTMLVIITTFVGFCMASGGRLDLWLLFWTLTGTALVAGASQTLNQVIEVEVDRLMERTQDRPIPAGRIKRLHALFFGVAMAITGVFVLAFLVNISAAVMAGATLFIYLGLYTPLKRHTPFCITVGAVAGAIPPALGWMAVKPSMDAGAAILFALLFFWQMPHFLAIAWLYKDQYALAGFKMLSTRDPEGWATSLQSLIYSVALLAITLVPGLIGMASPYYFFAAMALGAAMIYLSAAFVRNRTNTSARRLFFASIIYLPLLLGALIAFAR